MNGLRFLFLAAATVSLLCGQTSKTSRTIDFQREVRPVLSDNCFQCHGPDATTRMAGLRLDRREDAMAARPKGAAIVPGKIQDSLLYQRISAAETARRMPPEYSHKK